MDDCRTIPEMLIKAVEKYPSKNILNYKENSKWNSINAKDAFSTISNIVSALRFLGIKDDDKVSILSNTSLPPICLLRNLPSLL